MRSDKLTTKFQTALADAQSLAVGRDHQFIEPLHVMAALLDQEDGTVQHLLSQAGINVDALRARLDDALESLPRVEGTAGDVHVSRELERLLNLTDKLAQQRKDQYIASELWVLAALEGRGQLGDLLRAAGADKRRLSEAIDRLRGGHKVQDPGAEEQRQALERYTIDLTARA
ncbi:MAG: Clp protease N-terminal domain-containing protein, partial [Gammaproteobacteria bacterium]